MHVSKSPFFTRLAIVGACLLALTPALHAQAQAQAGAVAATHEFDVPPGDMAAALGAYVSQSGVQLLYKADDVRALTTKGVKGALTNEEALARLLEGTRLKVRRNDDGAVVIFASVDAQESARLADGAPMSVIVTATRRHEPAREVPMQVTAVPAETLEREGAKNLTDYVADQPGINLASAGTVGGQLSMRGVSTGLQSIATVGVYVDDVATGSSTAYVNGRATPLDMGLLDLRDIEILRGPQGTLYGAGAMGGLLKYTTNEPDPTELSGRIGLSVSSMAGGGVNNTVNGVINVPLEEDVAAIRVAAFRDHVAGYYDATGPAAGKHIDEGNTDGARFSALLTPSRDLSINFSAMTQDIKRGSLGAVAIDPTTRRFVDGDLTREVYEREPYSNRVQLYGLDVEYDFGWARLNSITSAQATDITSNLDVSPLYLTTAQQNGLPSASYVMNTALLKQDRFSQEFRLTSKASKEFEWLAGLYFNKERGSNDQAFNAGLSDSTELVNLIQITGPSRYREIAAYGDATWHLTSQFELTGGMRISRNQQSFDSTPSGPFNSSLPNNGSASQDSNTYLAAAKYALSKDSNIYFRAASGYRPGGPSGILPSTPDTPVKSTFKSDSLWSYEAGYKADLAQHTLSIEAAVFDIEWSDIQQPYSTGAITYVVNGGKARIDGTEISLTWLPTPDWRASFNAALTDARLRTDAPGLGAGAGASLPDNARVSASATLARNYSLSEHAAYSSVSARYIGQRNAGFSGSQVLPSVEMPSYTLFDLQSGIDFKSFSLGAYVRNVANRRSILAVNVLSPALVFADVQQPRTIGLSLNASF